jgi:beta-glucanase (GH16 family)
VRTFLKINPVEAALKLTVHSTGSFDWTTTDPKNSFISADGLNIVPTLTNQTTAINNGQISNGYTLNLTTDKTCTSSDYKQCSIKSNSTLGSIIPPVRSARITTKGKKTIKYGKVEVVAKFPKGDWLWPAIWYDTRLE